MNQTTKTALTLDLTTTRPPDDCRARLRREVERSDPAWHVLDLHGNGGFTVERRAAVTSIVRGARRQVIGVRVRGTLAESGGKTRVRAALDRRTRFRLALEFWRFPAIMGIVIALVPYHAFRMVVAALVVAIVPLVAVSWWRWWRLRREALKLVAALRDRLK